jgi:hypothetical protein
MTRSPRSAFSKQKALLGRFHAGAAEHRAGLGQFRGHNARLRREGGLALIRKFCKTYE